MPISIDVKEQYPHTIFIIPYRNRENDKKKFLKFFSELCLYKNWEENVDAMLLFSQQNDNRLFNRGAIKNIGFLAVKKLFPKFYKDITLIFNDIDTIPKSIESIPYECINNQVSHYYGYTFALGGIFAIKAGDFEKIKGFPNFWGWGLEDNCIYDRCIKNNIYVNRDVFYEINDPVIIQNNDSFIRKPSKRELYIYKYETPGSLDTLKNINFVIHNNSIIINQFKTEREPTQNEFFEYNIKNGSRIQLARGWFRRNWKLY